MLLFMVNVSCQKFCPLRAGPFPLFTLPFSLCLFSPFSPFSFHLFLRWYRWDKWYNRASRGFALYHLKNTSLKSGTDSATAVPPCTTFFKPDYLKWDAVTRASSACTTCPTLYHLFLRHARWHSDTEDAGGKAVNPGFADLRQANLRLVFPVTAGQQAFRFQT
ncbi:Uncharacterised protein [Escherichia coli]|nr:Uncharacterised protein [Escherichia coli]SQT68983.1 Uncharacterised protein [Escherichia coli]SQT78272.1 Uncharacterised protein [Escherichia coli]SQU35011.1 Uncharacterised protein [Escherichia coli]SQU42535.1 Uncharacterised protein [Escherichia coli]